MKRIFIALAVLLAVQVADAQVKSYDAAKKAVEAAEEAAQNPKKNTKVATWLKLATTYMDAYEAPAGNVLVNSPRVQLQMMMGNEKPQSAENVVIEGMNFKKEVYANKNLYFDEGDVLRIIEVTNPVFEDPLAKALEAYVKAYELDEEEKSYLMEASKAYETAAMYGGGGHKLASGVRFTTLEEVDFLINDLDKVCKEYLEGGEEIENS